MRIISGQNEQLLKADPVIVFILLGFLFLLIYDHIVAVWDSRWAGQVLKSDWKKDPSQTTVA
jgi:hypothetical protein